MPRHKTYLVICVVAVEGEIKTFDLNIEIYDINDLRETISYMFIEAKRMYKTEILLSDILRLIIIYKDTVVIRIPPNLGYLNVK